MVNARDFGPGKTALWALKMKWRTDILAYGALCEQLGAATECTEEWKAIDRKCIAASLDLYTRIAKLELDAQRYQEMVAKEASCLQT